ncbi:hypothetical protein M513_13865, partial [Trichuris suis]
GKAAEPVLLRYEEKPLSKNHTL